MLRFWCSTENDHGYHRRLGSKWAYCSQDCRRYRKKKEMCTRKSDSKEKMEPHYIAQEKPTFDYVEYEESKTEDTLRIYDLIQFILGR